MLLLIFKGLIAFVFGFSGANKMYFDEKALVAKGQTGVEGLHKYGIKFIGFSELLGSLAIVFGFFIDSMLFLTPIAIICLGFIMIPAAFIHFKRGELKNVLINILILLMCVFIVYSTYKTNKIGYTSETLAITQKELNAGKGNLKDANIDQWSKTVASIKQEYPDLKYVIPGHGSPGGTELLEYTIKLFKE